MSIRNLFGNSLLLFAALVVFGALVMGYAFAVEPNWLRVDRLAVESTRLPSSFAGYRIVQMSDLHLYRFNSSEKIRSAVDLALGLKPDLVVLTGDFVSSLREGEASELTRELSRLTAPDGVYAVLGNHDMWTDSAVVTAALERANITVLNNRAVPLRRGMDTLFLAGLGDVWEDQANLPLALNGIPDSAPVVMLVHEPDYADVVSRDPRVILQLSGHVHGGQVRFPGLQPLVTPLLGKKYMEGLYQVNDMQLYITRGVGVTFPPFRLFCRPEVSLLVLMEK